MALLLPPTLLASDLWPSVSSGIGCGGTASDEEESGGEMGKAERVAATNSWGGRGILDEGTEVGVEAEADTEDKAAGADCIG